MTAAPKTYYYEAWAGGDGAGRALSLYGGMTTALNNDVRADGFRLRTAAGYGIYAYSRSYTVDNRRAWQEFRGTMTSSDVLLGYQHAFGPWIIKVFAGGTQETHAVVAHGDAGLAFDNRNAVQGSRIGFKGALETWLNIDNWAFLQTDVSWSQPFEAYGGRIRAGYRINPAFSAGLEAGVHGNANHDAGRLGSFLRFEWTAGEISASVGAAANSHEITGAYGSLAVMIRF
ncbi:MAG: cellulose biosynthesis protein BcsS [Hyphomicrobiaceae bacterium]